MIDRDRAVGALLGAAVGDALGMPVDGLAHQNVRLYYKGIKAYRDDEKRLDLRAGQWTAHTQRLSALVRLLADLAPAGHGWSEAAVQGLDRMLAGQESLRRAREAPWGATADAAACAPAFGVWAAARDATADQLADLTHAVLWAHATSVPALAAAHGMARAVALALEADPAAPDGSGFFEAVCGAVAWFEEEGGMGSPVSERLRALAPHLDDTPLDLQDRCDGTGAAADEAFPFAVAMAARNPTLVAATLLSAINVGGASGAVGAMTGALLGAFNGWSAFPAEWREGLEDVERLEAEANALWESLEADV